MWRLHWYFPELKSKSRYDYIHECYFPRQLFEQKVFIFHMCINDVGSGASLVTQMQPIGNLQNAWIMFEHVKHVASWTTMACHVYDSTYYKVMTIEVCDIQFKDPKAQK